MRDQPIHYRERNENAAQLRDENAPGPEVGARVLERATEGTHVLEDLPADREIVLALQFGDEVADVGSELAVIRARRRLLQLIDG